MRPHDLSDNDVLTQLSRMEAAERFSSSPKLSSILRYVVEQSLAENDEALSGAKIGEAFFDWQDNEGGTNSAVRVTMRRLRSFIKDYYYYEGQNDPVVFSLPKGQYKVQFIDKKTSSPATSQGSVNTPSKPVQIAPQAPAAKPSFIKWGLGFAAGIAALAFISLVVSPKNKTETEKSYPVVAVKQFTKLDPSQSGEFLSHAVQSQMASVLEQNPGVKVVLSMTDESESQADYELSGTILEAGDTLDLLVELYEAGSTTPLFQDRFSAINATGSYHKALQSVATHVGATLFGPTGQFSEETSNTFGSFYCYSEFNRLEADRNFDRLNPTRDCILDALETTPNDSLLLAALGSLHILGSPEAGDAPPDISQGYYTMEKGEALIRQAIAADPGNDIAHDSLAVIQWSEGQVEAALDSALRASELNPSNFRAVAHLSSFYAMRDNWAESDKYSAKALALNEQAQEWVAFPRLLRSIMLDDQAALREHLRQLKKSTDPGSKIYVLLGSYVLGDMKTVNALLPVVQTLSENRNGKLLQPLVNWNADQMLLDKIASTLREAGVEFEQPIAKKAQSQD